MTYKHYYFKLKFLFLSLKLLKMRARLTYALTMDVLLKILKELIGPYLVKLKGGKPF